MSDDKKIAPEDEAAEYMQKNALPFLKELTKLSKRSLIRLIGFVCLYPFEKDKMVIRGEFEQQMALIADRLRSNKEVMFYAFNKQLEQEIKLTKGEKNETNK